MEAGMTRKEQLQAQVDQLEYAIVELEKRFSSMLQINHPQGQYKLGPGYNSEGTTVYTAERREVMRRKVDDLEQSVQILSHNMSKLIGADVLDAEEKEDMTNTHYADVNTQSQPNDMYTGNGDVIFQPDPLPAYQDYEDLNDSDVEITHL